MTLLWPMAGFALLVALWQAVVFLGGLPPAVLPGPMAVLATLGRGLGQGAYSDHLQATLIAAYGGLAIGGAAGVSAGAAVGTSRTLERYTLAVVSGLQALPLAAIAPLLIAWLGIGLASKIALASLGAFFPLFFAVASALRTAPPALVDLYRMHGAGRWVLLRDVLLPHAAGPALAALQVAVLVCFISVVISEMLAATKGIGFLIRALSGQLDLAGMFALVLLLAMFSAGSAAVVRWLQHRFVQWETTVAP
jgi:ABC-type nitrate/sulfonate/bicarbonate transport system permease component